MITTRKAMIGSTTLTVYSGNRNDVMPVTAQTNDRYKNLDDDITYIWNDGWVEIVDGEVESAITAGKEVVVKWVDPEYGGTHWFKLGSYDIGSEGVIKTWFYSVDLFNGITVISVFEVKSQDSTTWIEVSKRSIEEPELPSFPQEDGTYKLRCVVQSGVGVLSWVTES